MTTDAHKTQRTALPWAELMALGLGRLRLAPTVFWGMTLQELDAALVGAFGGVRAERPVRSELTALMAQFPDGDGEL